MAELTARVLRVDLSKRTTGVEEVPAEVVRKWIGGTGLGAYYLYKEVGPEVDWDDPENKVIIATGPLGNTRFSGTGTISCVFKGPMTGLAGSTQANGYLGAFLRSQGYDAIIVEGAADRLTQLHIDEHGVELRDAEPFAGLGTWQLEDRIRELEGLNDKQLSVSGSARPASTWSASPPSSATAATWRLTMASARCSAPRSSRRSPASAASRSPSSPTRRR